MSVEFLLEPSPIIVQRLKISKVYYHFWIKIILRNYNKLLKVNFEYTKLEFLFILLFYSFSINIYYNITCICFVFNKY